MSELPVPGIQTKIVELSYSDKQFVVCYEDKERRSYMRIYDLKTAVAWGKKEGECDHVKQIKAPSDHAINGVKWGPLDESIYYCTDRGRIIKKDLVEDTTEARDIHKREIFSITLTHDFTMLFTCSRDGTCKLSTPRPSTRSETSCSTFLAGLAV